MADVRLHRLLAQEEALPDLAVDQAVGDELQDLDLPHRRLLVGLLERSVERNDVAVGSWCGLTVPLCGHLGEAPAVVAVAGKNLVALSSVHGSCIGGAAASL